MLIRDARAAEVPRLRDMDWEAGQIFRDIEMPMVAEFDPRTLTELEVANRDGLLWVAADEDGAPASFLMAVVLDGCLHVDQLSTAPASARRGLGRALLDHAADRARGCGRSARTRTRSAWTGGRGSACGATFDPFLDAMYLAAAGVPLT